jgi:hypothetical protein
MNESTLFQITNDWYANSFATFSKENKRYLKQLKSQQSVFLLLNGYLVSVYSGWFFSSKPEELLLVYTKKLKVVVLRMGPLLAKRDEFIQKLKPQLKFLCGGDRSLGVSTAYLNGSILEYRKNILENNHNSNHDPFQKATSLKDVNAYFYAGEWDDEKKKKKRLFSYNEFYQDELAKWNEISDEGEFRSPEYVEEYEVTSIFDSEKKETLLGLIVVQYCSQHPLFGKHVYLDIWCSRVEYEKSGKRKPSQYPGVGMVALNHMLFRAFNLGYRKVRLTVVAASTAKDAEGRKELTDLFDTYQRLGFKPFGSLTEKYLKPSEFDPASGLENTLQEFSQNVGALHHMGLHLTRQVIQQRIARMCADLDELELIKSPVSS